MRKSWLIAGFAVWGIVSNALLHPQGASFTIFGRVSLPDGSPAARVTVRIERQGGAGRQIVTDDSGRYEISDLARGRYYISAENPAEPDQFTDPVEADTSRSPGTRIQANIYLRYRSKVVAPKASQGAIVTLAEELQQVPKAAKKSFEQGVRQRSDAQYEKALASFSRAIAQFPEFFQAFAERGHLRIGLGDASGAAADFDQALRINPAYGPALRGAGLCDFQQTRFSDAVLHLEKAADAEPWNATTYLFLGASNLALDRREQARAALSKALAIDPTGAARAHVHLANLSIKENRPHDAVAELDAYLATAPTAPDTEKLRTLAAQLHAQLK
jgi:tetratricopeptide (TPR) repeat protein